MERPVILTRSRRVTAALIAKYVNRASSLFTGAHAFHIRLSHRNSYSVGIFCIFLTLFCKLHRLFTIVSLESSQQQYLSHHLPLVQPRF